MDRYLVVSSDCHAGLPPERYRDYLDPQYREIFDAALPLQIAETKKAAKKFLVADINEEWRAGIRSGLSGAWDPDERTRVMDGDGCAAEVLFPDGVTEMNMPPFGAGLSLPTEGVDPELQWAGARSHNRWLADLCQADSLRRVGLAIVPALWDVDEAVKETRWAREKGLRGILLPNLWGDRDAYHHPKYDALWRTCEELHMVVNFHSGGAPMKDYGEHTGMMGIYISEMAWWAARPLTFLIWGGAFERFPGLRVMVTEATSIWVPEYLELLDFRFSTTHFAAKLGDYRSHLSMKPSDYFHRNVWLGASVMPRAEAEARHRIGVDKLCWGSDYPHPEGTWPRTIPSLVETFHGLPENEIERMLGTNLATLFGLDLERLAPIAERIGPERRLFRD